MKKRCFSLPVFSTNRVQIDMKLFHQDFHQIEVSKSSSCMQHHKSIDVLATCGNRETAIKMLRKGYATPQDSDVDGFVMLHTAARFGYLDLMKVLVEEFHVNLNPVCGEDRKRETPLLHAATFKQMECLQYLVQAGAQVDVRASDGRTALHCAARGDQALMVEYLLNLKNPATGRPYFTPDERNELWTLTPLTCAAMYDGVDTVLKLLLRGADAEIMDDRGVNALLCAVEGRAWKTAAVLISCGANTKITRRKDGRSIEEIMVADRDGEQTLRKGLKAFKRRKIDFMKFCYSEIPEFDVFHETLFPILFEYCPSAAVLSIAMENQGPSVIIPKQKGKKCILM
eukprot:TRINITY_DN6567_c0_g1_i1.p1 TRINITY_DN6567_c0_g1~~TRINITY_DN6567_c0_g1_i1.p1  ORF type:complete len:342 (-),score=80.96 TRINITY_DN6567_c0_g1_i1:519-1544(-)